MKRMSFFGSQGWLPLLSVLMIIQSSISPHALGGTASVTVGDDFFSPANVTINVNDNVQWTWSMSEVNPHSTTSRSSPVLWDSGVRTEPFSFSHTFTSAGSFPYWCTVHTTLMTGLVTVQNVAANVPPTVAITAPANNSTFNAPWTGTITATVSDPDDAVSKIEFFAGSTSLGVVANPPGNVSMKVNNLAAGNYTLTAVATDSRGATTTSAGVTIHVVTQSVPTNVPPTVAITAPANNSTFNAPWTGTITAAVSDPDDSVSKVEFFAGSTSLGVVANPPGNVSMKVNNLAAGNYTLTAVATDSRGASTTSAGVTIHVVTQSVPTNVPPTVAITAPANNSTFNAPWTGTITATVSDPDDSVSKVEFFAGSTSLGVVANPPGNVSMKVNNLAAGNYMLTAVATDSRGASMTSGGVTIHVVTPSGPGPVGMIGLSGNLAFGSVPAGHTATRKLVIANNGSTVLNVSDISFPPAFSGAFSGSIAPAGSQTVQVAFSPSDQASFGGTVVVHSDATSGSDSVPISGTGFFPLTNTWTIWWQHTDGSLARWSMLGTNAVEETLLSPSSPGQGLRVVSTAHFNGDGETDLLFEGSNGGLMAWMMNGSVRQTESSLTPDQVDPTWQARGTGDLNGNGGKVILWERLDGALGSWAMNGLTAAQMTHLNPPKVDPSWQIAATGDFNGDSKSDILWRNKNGTVSVWFMNGATRVSGGPLNPSHVDPSWRLAGSVDFNGDGHPGLLWEHVSGALAFWQMAGTNMVHGGRLNPASVDPAWQIVGPK